MGLLLSRLLIGRRFGGFISATVNGDVDSGLSHLGVTGVDGFWVVVAIHIHGTHRSTARRLAESLSLVGDGEQLHSIAFPLVFHGLLLALPVDQLGTGFNLVRLDVGQQLALRLRTHEPAPLGGATHVGFHFLDFSVMCHLHVQFVLFDLLHFEFVFFIELLLLGTFVFLLFLLLLMFLLTLFVSFVLPGGHFLFLAFVFLALLGQFSFLVSFDCFLLLLLMIQFLQFLLDPLLAISEYLVLNLVPTSLFVDKALFLGPLLLRG